MSMHHLGGSYNHWDQLGAAHPVVEWPENGEKRLAGQHSYKDII